MCKINNVLNEKLKAFHVFQFIVSPHQDYIESFINMSAVGDIYEYFSPFDYADYQYNYAKEINIYKLDPPTDYKLNENLILKNPKSDECKFTVYHGNLTVNGNIEFEDGLNQLLVSGDLTVKGIISTRHDIDIFCGGNIICSGLFINESQHSTIFAEKILTDIIYIEENNFINQSIIAREIDSKLFIKSDYVKFDPAPLKNDTQINLGTTKYITKLEKLSDFQEEYKILKKYLCDELFINTTTIFDLIENIKTFLINGKKLLKKS